MIGEKLTSVVLAAEDSIIGQITPPPGISKYGEEPAGLGMLLNNVLRLIIVVAGIFALFNFILAGYSFMSAAGDPKKVELAWAKIWQSMIGLLIIVASFALAALVGQLMFGGEDNTAGLGPWANPTEPGVILSDIVSMALGVMTLAAGIWFLFQAIIAGYNFLSAGGDKERLTNAGRKLTNSIIGLAIVIGAYALMALMGRFFGVNFLEVNEGLKTIIGVSE